VRVLAHGHPHPHPLPPAGEGATAAPALIQRRALLAGAAALPLLDAKATTAERPGNGTKTLRVFFPVAEVGFDPPRLSDLYSRTVTAHIFEALFGFDHLARPVKLKPLTAVALPEASDDFKTWTMRIKPGIFFADDPAFKGAKRELVAQDYVYSFQRFADPAVKSPFWSSFDEVGFIGLAEKRQRALDSKQPFDYDAPIEGLMAIDRFTLRFRLKAPKPRLPEQFAASDLVGAVAREVVEHYGDTIPEHPVGTGPFRLAAWRRSSQMVFERNPNHRRVWAAEPRAGDAEGEAIVRAMAGKAVPQVDRVIVSVIEEAQPRWLSFLDDKIDVIAVPQEFVPVATPGGVLAPNLARRGIQHWRVLLPVVQMAFFNMEHPLVGGNAAPQVALRRAIGLATNTERIIRLGFRGQAIPAQSVIIPGTTGYDPAFRSENGEYNPARAKALLDVFGYADRDGDGWREQPDGQPLVLECSTQPESLSRQLDELLKKDMDAIGLKIVFKPAKWPENLKAVRAGKFMMWRVGSSASLTDGQEILGRLYGPQAGQANIARFKNAEFDRVYEALAALPDGPERNALFDKAKRLSVAHQPYKVLLHQLSDVLAQPWVQGYRRPTFGLDWWHMVDIDAAAQQAAG
jgi:ABC-type transport system substrate-binding protein